MENLERVFGLERQTDDLKQDSYILSYRDMLGYFEGIRQLTSKDIVVGAHMVYGWMPTIVHLNKEGSDPGELLRILQSVKDDKADLSEDELITIKRHMPHQYQVNNPGTYLKYREKMLALEQHPRFPEFHASVNSKLKYEVSGLRALELIMFLQRDH